VIRLLHDLRRLRRRLGLNRPTGGSLAVRMVDAGSCNGCEHELNAVNGPHYDLQRLGINIVASPRHADVLLVSGAVTGAMVEPLRRAHDSMPDPKVVVAFGNCALGIDPLGDPEKRGAGVAAVLPPGLGIPGCPPPPEEIIAGLSRCLRRPGSGDQLAQFPDNEEADAHCQTDDPLSAVHGRHSEPS